MHWGFGPLMMIMVMVLYEAMMFFIMRGLMGGHNGRFNDRDALDILKERFARGAIIEIEYEERRRRIEA